MWEQSRLAESILDEEDSGRYLRIIVVKEAQSMSIGPDRSSKVICNCDVVKLGSGSSRRGIVSSS
jgi:hypothetical protein